MNEELVHLEITGGIATVTLDSPANRNALSRALMAGLNESLDAALADDRARLIVLTGAGPVFCSGADLKEQRGASEAGPGAGPGGLVAVLQRIWRSPKPVIAWPLIRRSSWRNESGSPSATRICSRTISSPAISSVTGCSTCRRVFISMK